MEKIAEAVHALYSVCDGANEKDGVGFNSTDSPFASRLCAIPFERWTLPMLYEAWQMLSRYKAQLLASSIEYEELPVPQKPEKLTGKDDARRLRQEMGGVKKCHISSGIRDFVVAFPYDEQILSGIKSVKGARWNPEGKLWNVPLESFEELVLFSRTFDFSMDDDILEKAKQLSFEALESERTIMQQQFETVQINFDYNPELVMAVKALPGRVWDSKKKVWTAQLSEELLEFADKYGFKMNDSIRLKIADASKVSADLLEASVKQSSDFEVENLSMSLLPYQKAGVEYIAKTKRCLLADSMGLGKTAQALASLEHLDAFPALVVCPASLKENWRREVQKWIPHRTTCVLSGKSDITNADIIIVNYDIVGRFVEPLQFVDLQALVCDESHYIKEGTSQRTKAIKKISKYIPNSGIVLLMSGTPVLNKPKELVSQLDVLGVLPKFGGQWTFYRRYTNAKKTRFGWDFSGHSNLGELNTRMRQICYVRRLKEDVLTELPDKSRNVVYVEPSGLAWKEYKKAEADLISFLRDNGYKASDSAEHLRKTGVLKQLAAQSKMDAVYDWIDSFLESTDRKLVVFAHNVAVVDALAQRYGGLRISGRDSMEDRQFAVDSFQNDSKSRVIVLNIKAGGVGLTLTAASDVMFVQQGWTPGEHDQAEDRCHRIGQKNNVQIYYILASKTIDEDIYSLIEAKRKVVDAATDGDSVEDNSILSDLMQKFARRNQDT